MISGVLFSALSIGHTGLAIGHRSYRPKSSILGGVREILTGSVSGFKNTGKIQSYGNLR